VRNLVIYALGETCVTALPLPVTFSGAMLQIGHQRGIDLRLNKFAATSDGELIERPRFLELLHRKLTLLQRK